MILLTGASDVLRIVTSGTANIDVVAGFADHASGVVTPGRSLTTIGSAATTTIVAAPGASTQRTVRFLTIRNRHASTANTITLQLFDGTTAFEIHKITLAAGEALIYDEGTGFSYISSLGLPKAAESQGGSQAAVNALNLVVLASDVTNNNATLNTIADITGLSFAVVAGEGYFFRATIDWTSAVNTTGARFSVNGPASPTRLAYRSNYALTTTTETLNAGLTTYDLPAASNASPANIAGNIAIVEGFIQPSANGTVTMRFASEVASSAIVAKKGSILEWVRTF
jgi:hypothetical protein